MKTVGYYNGVIDEVENLKIPVLDRSVYFGDGVYDVAICENRKTFQFDRHIDRFYRSCRKLDIDFNMSKTDLKDLLNELISKADDNDLMVYWQASRGIAPRKHEYYDNIEPALLVMITPFKVPDYRKKMRLITVPDTRFLHCDIKTINLIPNVIAAKKAMDSGCQEAVLHRGSYVTECAHSSLFIIKDDELLMPPQSEFILPGITRKVVEKICAENEIPLRYGRFNVDDMMAADEIIIASTTKHLASASEIDNIPVGGKNPELLELLQTLFMAKFEKETEA